MARSLMSHPIMQPHSGVELVPGASVQGPQLESFVHSTGAFSFHAIGTCKMGADDDPDAVVDSNLRVRGVRGLRVADASVIPSLPRSGLMSVAYMVGEAAAEFIAESQSDMDVAETLLHAEDAGVGTPQLAQLKEWITQCSSVEKVPYEHADSNDLEKQAEHSAVLVLKLAALAWFIGFAIEALGKFIDVARGQTAGEGSRLTNLMQAAHDMVDRALMSAFAFVAKLCATKPIIVMVTTWAICFTVCTGFYFLRVNDDIMIWIPKSSRVKSEFEDVRSIFPDLKQESLLLQREDAGNILHPDAMRNARDILGSILAVHTSSGETMADMCVTVPGADACLIEGPLEAWLVANQLNRSMASTAITMNHKLVIETLGDPVLSADSEEVISATAILLQFYCINRHDRCDVWEHALEDVNVLDALSAGPKMSVVINSHGKYHDAVNSTLIDAIPFYVLSAFFMQVYILFAFGSRDFCKSQVTLGICGEITVLMASLSAGGTYSALGYEVTHISICVLFLLMGIGLDDMFVLMKAFEREDVSHSVELRLAACMQEAGSSITVTTLTNVVAFSVGGQLPFPALSAFCIFLALGVAFTLFYFLSFFVCYMVLDERRKQHGHIDLIFRPFVSRAKTEEGERPKSGHTLATQSNRVMSDDSMQDPVQDAEVNDKNVLSDAEMDNDVSRYTQSQTSESGDNKEPDKLYLFIENNWAPLILHPNVRVRGLIFFFYILTFCVAVYGVYTLRIKAHRQMLGLEEGTELMEYLKFMRGEPMSHRGIPVDIILGPDATRDADGLQKLIECLKSNEYITGTPRPWSAAFKLWLMQEKIEFPTGRVEYDARVLDFIAGETGAAFENDVIFSNERIVRSRMHAYFRGDLTLQGPQAGLDAMLSVQQCTDDSALDAFPFCEMFATDWAEISVLTEAFVHGLTTTLAAVALVTMAMPGVPPKNAMWMCIVLLMCIIQIVGWISISGTEFWAQTLAQTTIAVGLAVDYSLHIGHSFGMGGCGMGAPGSFGKRERAQLALTTMGSSVLRGAFTTALGIFPLFLGGWSVLDEFANNILIIVLQGLFHGFVLLPLVLSTLGASHPNDGKHTAEEAVVNANPSSDFSKVDSPPTSPVDTPNVQLEQSTLETDEENLSADKVKTSRGGKKLSNATAGADVTFDNPVTMLKFMCSSIDAEAKG